MKLPTWISALCLSLLGLVVGLVLVLRPSAAPVKEQRHVSAEIDDLVKKALDSWQIPGAAVAVVRGNDVIYLKGFGVKERGKTDPVTPDTLFPIASCTKAFTTTAMAMLVDEGKMGWDDPVRKHVPYFHLSDPLADSQVTLRDLVSHRTGVGSNDFLWYHSPWSREEVVRRIGLVKPKHSFRSAFQYQTTMFTAAGLAVESAGGCRWEEFIQKRIFDPLGMSGANFTTAAALRTADHASPHRKNDKGVIEVIPWYAIETPEPAGSINASARDLTRWLRFQLGDGTFEGKRLVSTANLNETHTPQTIIRMEGEARAMHPETIQMSYGMAWVIQDYRGHKLVSHAGLIDGFRAHFTLVPDSGIGIVLLTNLDRVEMNLPLSNSIVDLLLDLPRKDWQAHVREQQRKQESVARADFQQRQEKRHKGTIPSRELSAYAGKYEHPAYGMAEVSFKDGNLTWKWNSFTNGLEHFHFDTFTLTNDLMSYPQVEFSLGTDGEVKAMKIAAPLEVEFVKKSTIR